MTGWQANAIVGFARSLVIKNDQQYQITKYWAGEFAQSLLEMRREKDAGRLADLHPLLIKAREEATQSQLADLEADLREYDALKAGQFDFARLNYIAEIPQLLIKARIARGWSQRELARRVGIREQQIQRYEAANYATTSLMRVKEIAAALRWDDAENPYAHLDPSMALDLALAVSRQS